MTDTPGDIDHATKAAREAAERVHAKAADASESFGATAQEIADDLSASAVTAKSELPDTVGDVADKIAKTVGNIDVDGFLDQTRTVAGDWTEKVKQAYRERPAVVIAAAAGAMVLALAVLRSLTRR